MTKTPEYRTEQESFWAGEFGTNYIARNRGDALLASNLAFFSKALAKARAPQSCLEFGANVGMNLKALKLLFPALDCHGIEINAAAANALSDTIPATNIHTCSVLEFVPRRKWDLVLIKGVLIHMNPDCLQAVYDLLVTSTESNLLVAEYYNPVPTSVSYRGHEQRLFKRDFVGEILDTHPNLRIIDYGFAYHRDPVFPLDDITWFLLQKT